MTSNVRWLVVKVQDDISELHRIHKLQELIKLQYESANTSNTKEMVELLHDLYMEKAAELFKQLADDLAELDQCSLILSKLGH